MLRATGNVAGQEPWVPVGAGVHTGAAFVGTVGAGGEMLEFTALGDAVSTAARLASVAEAGELIASEAAFAASGIVLGGERRELSLKGVSLPVPARVLRASAGS